MTSHFKNSSRLIVTIGLVIRLETSRFICRKANKKISNLPASIKNEKFLKLSLLQWPNSLHSENYHKKSLKKINIFSV